MSGYETKTLGIWPSGAGDLDMERTVGKTERKDGECCHMISGIGSGDNGGMTIATPERYAQMLDAARRGGYAYPAINVTSTQTLNAALQGFAEAESDGIIQVSVGGAATSPGNASTTASPARLPSQPSRTKSRRNTPTSPSPCTPTTAPNSIWTNGCASCSTMKSNR